MIRLNIEVETDGDFSLNFPTPKNSLEYMIKKVEGGYNIKIDFYQKESEISKHIIEFLQSVEIDSSKHWHKEQLAKEIENYKNLIEKEGLTSYGDMLGGNWLFSVILDRISKERFI